MTLSLFGRTKKTFYLQPKNSWFGNGLLMLIFVILLVVIWRYV